MAGEQKAAEQLLDAALAAADADGAMSRDTMLSALLRLVLKRARENRTRTDVLGQVEFELDAMGETEFVITRGS